MDTLAEWPRRRPAKPMGSLPVGSNFTNFALVHPSQMMPANQFTLTRHNTYTWPGSNRRPSACEADVIATRPQLLCCTRFRVWSADRYTTGPDGSVWEAGTRTTRLICWDETLWLSAIRSVQLSYETSCWPPQLLGQGFRLPFLFTHLKSAHHRSKVQCRLIALTMACDP